MLQSANSDACPHPTAQALCGFQEPPLRFPPTYRRRHALCFVTALRDKCLTRPIVTRARARHQVGEGDDVRRFLQVRITRRAHKYFRCVERVLTPRTCRATSCSCTSSSTSSCCASPRFLSSPPYITLSYQVEGCTVSWMGDHIIRCFPQVRGRAARPRARGQQGRPAGRAAARGALGLRVLEQVLISGACPQPSAMRLFRAFALRRAGLVSESKNKLEYT